MVKPIPPPSISHAWPAPNLVSPQIRGPALPVVGSLLIALVTVTLAGRVWVRWQIRRMGADDWLIVAAYIPAVALFGASMASLRVGWDRHIWDQRPEWHDPSELVSWLIQLFYTMTMALAKLSILTSYLRIIPFGAIRIVIWCTLGLVGAWGVSLTFATLFSCYPVALYWTSYTGAGCTDESVRLLVTSIVSIGTDAIVVILPIAAFARLRLPMRQKVALICLLSLGVFATLASMCRTVLLAKALEQYDVTWIGYNMWIMTGLECDLALICASVPALRPLFGKWMRELGEHHGDATTLVYDGSDPPSMRSRRSFRKSRVPDLLPADPELRRIRETVEFEVRISEDVVRRSDSGSGVDSGWRADHRERPTKNDVWIEELSRVYIRSGRQSVV